MTFRLGYVNDRNTRTIVPDSERFDVIRRAWDLMLTEAYTVPQVLHVLNKEWGYRTKPGPRRLSGPLTLSALYHVFHNPFYAGAFTSYGRTHEGKHNPMVTPEEFRRVQTIIARQLKQYAKRHEYAYTGLMRCARCGCAVTAETQYGRSGTGRYVYYHCTNYKRTCLKVSMREDHLEEQVEQLLKRATISPKVEEFALRQVERWRVRMLTSGTDVAERQASTIGDLTSQQSALLDLCIRGIISDEEFSRKRSELDAEISYIRGASDEAARKMDAAKASARNTIRFMTGAHSKFLVGTATEKREIARGLSIQYEFHAGRVRISPHPTLAAKHHILRAYRCEQGTVETSKVSYESSESLVYEPSFSSGTAAWDELEKLFYGADPFPDVPCLSESASSLLL